MFILPVVKDHVSWETTKSSGRLIQVSVVTQKWPFLDVFAIHDNVSFSCHKDIVKLNGMTVSVYEYEKEWERRRMGNEWMKSKIKSLNEWSEWGTNDCKIP